jgi:hypothetical protein
MSRGHRSATFVLLDYAPHRKEAAHQERELRTGTKEVVNVELGKYVQCHIIVIARVDFVRNVCSTFFGGRMDDNVTEQSCTL